MHDDHSHHEHPKYAVIFGALCVFTLISIMADVIHLPYGVKVVAVLSVATCKALCVMAWFMHLKFERAWKYVLLAPTTILALGLPLALMPDVGEHYYTQEVPQSLRFELTDKSFESLRTEAVPEALLLKLNPLKNKEFETRNVLLGELIHILSEEELNLSEEELKRFQEQILNHAQPSGDYAEHVARAAAHHGSTTAEH